MHMNVEMTNKRKSWCIVSLYHKWPNDVVITLVSLEYLPRLQESWRQHGANLSAQSEPHIDSMNLAIRVCTHICALLKVVITQSDTNKASMGMMPTTEWPWCSNYIWRISHSVSTYPTRTPNAWHGLYNYKLCVFGLGLMAEFRYIICLIARFMGPTWGPSGAARTQVGPMLAPWTLLSGLYCHKHFQNKTFYNFF